MITSTHMLTAAAILSERDKPYRNAAAVLGGVFPDLSIFVLFGWAKLQGVAQWEIWRKLYWHEPWQTLGAISNSFPIWGALLVLGLAVRSTLMTVFAAAVVIHLALDLPVHADDAHRHFWPLTDWRFHSPLSYWDTDHHSRIVNAIEIGICCGCIAVLWRRFTTWWVRLLLGLGLSSLVLVALFFWITLR